MASTPGKQSEIWAQAAYYAGLGFILPGGVVVGYFFGWILDRWLHTAPYLAVILAILGAGGGFIEILKILGRAEKDAERKSSGSGSSTK
jgi:F0F1-type ATP synthase assembly protein I